MQIFNCETLNQEPEREIETKKKEKTTKKQQDTNMSRILY